MDMDGGDVVITQRRTDIIKVIYTSHKAICVLIKWRRCCSGHRELQ